jgi:hypothetical protein
MIWSFGNNGVGYIFGRDIEEEKKSIHMAVVFNEFNSWFKDTFKIDGWPPGLGITGRRLYLRKLIKLEKRIELEQLEQLERLQQLEQLERLQQLGRLEQPQQLQQLELTCLDYRQVKIEKNAVIYCDIPYQDTENYGNEFNHKDFFDWANDQKNPVFISEYEIKDGRFLLLKEISHRSTFSAGGLKSIPTVERLYGNKIAYDIIQKALNI